MTCCRCASSATAGSPTSTAPSRGPSRSGSRSRGFASSPTSSSRRTGPAAEHLAAIATGTTPTTRFGFHGLLPGTVRDVEFFGTLSPTGRGSAIAGLVLDVTERQRTQTRLSSLAFSDALTGLANRAQFVDRLRDALTSRTGGRHALRGAARGPRRLQGGQRSPRPRSRRSRAAGRRQATARSLPLERHHRAARRRRVQR